MVAELGRDGSAVRLEVCVVLAEPMLLLYLLLDFMALLSGEECRPVPPFELELALPDDEP